MGTIAHRFETGEQSSQKGHFRNLIMLARIDGKVGEEEKALLSKIANRLALTDEQVKEILDDSNSYPMIPPISREERYERFIQLIQMILADNEISDKEDILVHRYGIALGFTQERMDEKYPVIVEKLRNGISREDILDNIL
jgi:hypothetical protein